MMRLERIERRGTGERHTVIRTKNWTWAILWNAGRPVWWLPRSTPVRIIDGYEVRSLGLGWLLVCVEILSWRESGVMPRSQNV
jgi:hypothetical protein